jgi:hypothetical protein
MNRCEVAAEAAGMSEGADNGRRRAQEVSVILASVPVQPSLKSTELVPIGEAAQFGLRPSALRYFEDRGLITPLSTGAGSAGTTARSCVGSRSSRSGGRSG